MFRTWFEILKRSEASQPDILGGVILGRRCWDLEAGRILQQDIENWKIVLGRDPNDECVVEDHGKIRGAPDVNTT